MNYKVGYRIQTGGQRPRWVLSLIDILTEDGVNADDIQIINRKPLWEACKAALLSSTDETHLVIMQDDILPCMNFDIAVKEIIRARPTDIVTLFTNSPHSLTPLYNYLSLDVWFMAQCYIVPVGVARDMVRWIDENVKTEVQLDDDRMATYCWYNRRRVLATIPSLVEHIGWKETTLRHYEKNDFVKKAQQRTASVYIGFESSGVDIDWQKDYVLEVNEGSDKMFISNLNYYASKNLGNNRI